MRTVRNPPNSAGFEPASKRLLTCTEPPFRDRQRLKGPRTADAREGTTGVTARHNLLAETLGRAP